MVWRPTEKLETSELENFRFLPAVSAEEQKEMSGVKLFQTLHIYLEKWWAAHRSDVEATQDKLLKMALGVSSKRSGALGERQPEAFRVKELVHEDDTWPSWMKAEPPFTYIVRVTQDGTFNASGEAWPYVGWGGCLKALKGDLCVSASYPAKFASDVQGDTGLWLKQLSKELKANKPKEKRWATAVMKPGDWLWIPFGWQVVAYGIEESRPQADKAKADDLKRRRLTRKQSSTPDGYSSYCFLPCLRKDDSEERPDIVAATYARWISNAAFSPAKCNNHDVTKRWSSLLKEKTDVGGKKDEQEDDRTALTELGP